MVTRVSSLHVQQRNWKGIESTELRRKIEERVQDVVARLMDPQRIRDNALELGRQLPEREGFLFAETDLAGGFAGMCFLFAEMDRMFPEQSWARVGHQFLVEVQKGVETGRIRGLGLFGGLTGVGMSVRALSCNGTRYQTLLSKLNQLIVNHYQPALNQAVQGIATGVHLADFDVISGWSGIGRYLLCCREEPEMKNVLHEVLEYLVLVSEDKTVKGQSVPGWYVTYEQQTERNLVEYPNGHINIGLAHGIPGPLALLSLALSQGVEVPGQREAIRRIAEMLLRWQMEDEQGPFWNGRISWEEWTQGKTLTGSTRAAWCYGTPGVARALWLAGEALAEEEWKRIAVEAYLALFRRPRESWRLNSPNLCHGLAGFAAMTQRMYIDSGVEELAMHRDRLVESVLALYDEKTPFGFYDIVSSRTGTYQYHFSGLLEGATGTALVLSSLISPQEPQWEAVLMIQ